MNVLRNWVAPTLAILCVSPALGDEASDRSACEVLTADTESDDHGGQDRAGERFGASVLSCEGHHLAGDLLARPTPAARELERTVPEMGRRRQGRGTSTSRIIALLKAMRVANSNMGHDSGSEPGASFAFNNRQAEIDFGYRAVHLTVKCGEESDCALLR